MYLVISKCVTAVILSNFSGHYLRYRSTLDIGVLGYIGIVPHKEHSPEVLSIPPGTPVYPHIVHSTHASQVIICSHNTDNVLHELYVSTVYQVCNFS